MVSSGFKQGTGFVHLVGGAVLYRVFGQAVFPLGRSHHLGNARQRDGVKVFPLFHQQELARAAVFAVEGNRCMTRTRSTCEKVKYHFGLGYTRNSLYLLH